MNWRINFLLGSKSRWFAGCDFTRSSDPANSVIDHRPHVHHHHRAGGHVAADVRRTAPTRLRHTFVPPGSCTGRTRYSQHFCSKNHFVIVSHSPGRCLFGVGRRALRARPSRPQSPYPALKFQNFKFTPLFII